MTPTERHYEKEGRGADQREQERERDKGKKSERKSFRSSYEGIKDGTLPKWKCLYELLLSIIV